MIKLNMKVTYQSGEVANYPVALPEWSKWERKTGKSVYNITQARLAELGLGGVLQMSDFLFLAHCAYVRQAAGKPTKPYDIWEAGVEEVDTQDYEDPKVSPSEASNESGGN